MKIQIFLIVFLSNFILGCNLKNNQINTTIFTLYAPTLNNDSTVFITGSHVELGNWDPGKIQMENIGDHTWGKTIPIQLKNSIEYKYTLGSWEHEGADIQGKALPNFVFIAGNNPPQADTVVNWKTGKEENIHGQITGNIKYHFQVKGENLLPRDIIVWLPPNYNSNADIQYPVLYMLDGQNIIDPKTSTFGVDWSVDETCDSLIRNYIINPLIVVGIYNTENRSAEYLPGDTSQLFMNHIINDIKPLIDINYRTLINKENTWIGGSSSGGTLAFMLCWKYPNIFSRAICMSPAFKIEEIDIVKNVSDYKGQIKPVKIFIYNGGIDLEADLQPGVNEMIEALNKKGYEQERDFTFLLDKNAFHTEASWAKHFSEAIQFISKK